MKNLKQTWCLKLLNKRNILFTLVLYTFFTVYAQDNWLESFLNSKENEYYLFTDKELKMNNIDGTIWLPENVIENSEKKSNQEKTNTFHTKGYLVVNKNTVLKLDMEWIVAGDAELEKKDLAIIDIKICEIKSIIVLKESDKKSINEFYQFSVYDNKLFVKDLITNNTQVFKLHKTISSVGDDNESLWSEYIRSTYF